MLKAAVIGVGSMGRNHVRVYRELDSVELVGISDNKLSTAEKIGSIYGVPHFSDYLEMLDECRPDLVSLVVPTDEHFSVAMDLIERGIGSRQWLPPGARCASAQECPAGQPGQSQSALSQKITSI